MDPGVLYPTSPCRDIGVMVDGGAGAPV